MTNPTSDLLCQKAQIFLQNIQNKNPKYNSLVAVRDPNEIMSEVMNFCSNGRMFFT